MVKSSSQRSRNHMDISISVATIMPELPQSYDITSD